MSDLFLARTCTGCLIAAFPSDVWAGNCVDAVDVPIGLPRTGYVLVHRAFAAQNCYSLLVWQSCPVYLR